MATLSLRLDALGIAVGRHALHARTLLVSMAKHALTRAHAHALYRPGVDESMVHQGCR